MLKRGIILAVLVLISRVIFSQEVSHKVLTPLGSFLSVGGYSVAQTIGEPVVEYCCLESYELTQGFQQPSFTPIRLTNRIGNGVLVYPNPVKNDLRLEMFGKTGKEYNVTIFGISGSIFFRKQYQYPGQHEDIKKLDFSKYVRGIYFVRVESKDKSVLRVFKIEKM